MLAKEDLDLNEYNVQPGSLLELPSRLYGGGKGDDARVDVNTSVSTNQGSERATASVVESIGALEGNLPEGDPPERIRTALNSASPQRQDHATTAEPEPEPQVDAEPEPQPEPEPEPRRIQLELRSAADILVEAVESQIMVDIELPAEGLLGPLYLMFP